VKRRKEPEALNHQDTKGSKEGMGRSPHLESFVAWWLIPSVVAPPEQADVGGTAA
jgi:hypothetical protein